MVRHAGWPSCHGTGDANHGLYASRAVRDFFFERTRPPPMLFTNHETRLFLPWVRDGWRHRKPPSGPLPTPTSHRFPVHHCSLLFAIVQQKILPAPVSSRRPVTACLPPVSRYFPAKNVAPEPMSAHRPLLSVGLTTSAVRRRSRRPPGSFRCNDSHIPTTTATTILSSPSRGHFYRTLTQWGLAD